MGEPHVRAGDDDDDVFSFRAGPNVSLGGSKVGGGSEVRQQGQASLPRVQRPEQCLCAIAVRVARADGKRAVQRRGIDRVGVPKSDKKGTIARGAKAGVSPGQPRGGRIAKEPVGGRSRA